MKFLDRKGITLVGDPDMAVAVYDIQYDTDIEPENWSPGDSVITGPWGASSWSWLPSWVVIEVVPDDTKVDHKDPMADALKRFGLSASYKNKPPLEPALPAKGVTAAYLEKKKRYERYLEAVKWAEAHTPKLRVEMIEGSPPYEIVTDPGRALEVIHSLHGKHFGWDFETTGIDPHTAKPVGLALADSTHSWYIARDALKVLPEMESLLKDPTCLSAGSNVKYEYEVFYYATGIWPSDLVPSYDTQVMHWLANAGNQFGMHNGLKAQSKRLLGRTVLEYDDIIPNSAEAKARAEGWGSAIEHLQSSDAGLNLVGRYAAAGDARNSLDLVELHLDNLAKDIVPKWPNDTTNLLEVYRTFELGLTPILAEMEIAGMLIDLDKTKSLYVDMLVQQTEVENELRALGFDGNFDSGDQIAKWLYEDLDLPVLAMTDSGSRGKVDEPTLNLLEDRVDHPAPTLLKKRSGLAKLNGTFLLPVINDGVTHIHHSIKQTSTGTGRLAAANPNTNNQPTKVRSMFVAPEGQVYWARDWSQEEPRIGAVLSGDMNMLAPYLKEPFIDGDPHKPNPEADAYIQLGLRTGFDPEKVMSKDKATRTTIKAAFLGVGMYGGGARKLQQKLREEGVYKTIAECQAIQQSMDAAMPNYVRYRKTQPQRAREAGGAAFSMHGRREWIPELFYKDPNRRASGERKAINMPIQGTGADFLKLSIQRTHALIKQAGGTHRNPVHDEITGTWSEEAELELGSQVNGIMENFDIVPLRVESGYARDWLSAKP